MLLHLDSHKAEDLRRRSGDSPMEHKFPATIRPIPCKPYINSIPTVPLTSSQFSNYGDMLYNLTACFTKLSIILLVLRLFCPSSHDRFFWILQALNLLNTSFYICYLIIPILACHPRVKIWQKHHPGTCLNIFILYITSSVFNALSDIAMLAVPLWRIWNLGISRSRKVGLVLFF